MIPWRKYDKDNDSMIIEGQKYLATNIKHIAFLKYTQSPEGEGYEWTDLDGFPITGVTHYAVINLPGEEEA